MEVTALCVRLLMEVFVLLAAQAVHSTQRADAAFPHVVPRRLQFFEYESISVRCEQTDGITDWRVTRRLQKIMPTNSSDTCSTSAPYCTLYPAFERDSGEYWCETEVGETSNAVNITVTAGPVILELPVRPVAEGEDVTLHCKNKNTESEHIVDFYKDGSHLDTLYYSTMIIQNISKSDEGLYKCSISGAGESPESWLSVLALGEAPDEGPHSRGQSPTVVTLVWTVSVSVVALLLAVTGVYLCRKHKGGGREDDPDNLTYAAVTDQGENKGTGASRAATRPRLPEESVIYSSVNCR